MHVIFNFYTRTQLSHTIMSVLVVVLHRNFKIFPVVLKYMHHKNNECVSRSTAISRKLFLDQWMHLSSENFYQFLLTVVEAKFKDQPFSSATTNTTT